MLARGRPQDDEVLEDLSWIRRLHLHQRGRVPSQPFAEVHDAVVAEGHDRLAGPCIDRLQIAVHLEQQPAIRAVLALPVVDPTRGDAAEALVNPDLLAGRRVECDERVVAREHVCDVVDDDRVEDIRHRVAGRVGPRHAEPLQVGLVDLGQCDVPGVVGRAAEVRPVGGLPLYSNGLCGSHEHKGSEHRVEPPHRRALP
jgi:hypothetical protein